MDLFRAFLKGFRESMTEDDAADGNPEAHQPAERLADDPSEIIKEPPMEIVGEVLSASEFVEYVERLNFPPPLPTRVFLHHTWRPTLETWRGMDSILGMKAYYEKQLWEDSQGRTHEGWTAGPHLFIADDGIWLFTHLRQDGVGVYGNNYRSRHIEMVGNYDHERPDGAVLENTITALGVLHERLGLDVSKLNFHRDFSSKSCPGWAVQKGWIIPQVQQWVAGYRRGKEEGLATLRRTLLRMIQEQDLDVPINPHAALAKTAQARGLLAAITNEFPMEIDDRGYMVQLFAEALLVPVHEWDKVQSLAEYEASHPEAAAHRDVTEPGEKDVWAPPPDAPWDFEGDIR